MNNARSNSTKQNEDKKHIDSQYSEPIWNVVDKNQKRVIASSNKILPLRNRFASLSFTNNDSPLKSNEQNEREYELFAKPVKSTKQTKTPKMFFDQHSERNTGYQRTYPGNSSYADIVNKCKKVMLFCDSHGKRIRRKEFNKYLVNANAHIKSFPGATAKHLNHYVIPALHDEKPDAAVIMVGTNDINRNNKIQQDEKEIAEEIINVGRKCRESGVNEIFISSITCQRNAFSSNKIKLVNESLKDMCVREHFIYICHESIKQNHLYRDGIHLLEEGTNILSNNIITSINTSF